ncbi:MAG: TetR/AcrR family transcriptional regulator [Candidatus Dormibacteria bacterium]
MVESNIIHAMHEVKPSRRERAAATRRAIIEAATAEFTEGGYHATKVESIARRAGVATQTVYFVFHTKAALLTAAIDAAVLGAGTPPQMTGWWADASSAAEGARSIELFIGGTAEIFTRAALLNQVAGAAAVSDPEVAQVLAHHELLREQGYREFADTLGQRGLLQAAVSVKQATDVLLTLAGPSVYLELTRSRGWTSERYKEWVCMIIGQLLLR